MAEPEARIQVQTVEKTFPIFPMMCSPTTTAIECDYLPQRQHPRGQFRILGLLGWALLGGGMLALVAEYPAWGQSISNATVTEILDSNQVYIQNQQAQVNGVAQRQQRVRTESARTSLRFNTGAVARLSHNSSLVVGQCAQLNRGTLLVNGTLNGCSTTTVAGVRGTLYTLEVTEDGQTIVQVFEGEVTVQPQTEVFEPIEDEEPQAQERGFPERDSRGSSEPKQLGIKQTEPSTDPNPVPPDGATPDPNSPSETPAETMDFNPDSAIVVTEGQQVTVDAEQEEAVITALTPEDFIELLEGPLISGFAAELPGISDLRGAFERLFPDVPVPSSLLPISVPVPVPSLRLPF